MKKELINIEEAVITYYISEGRERDLINGCICWYDNGEFEFDTTCPVHFAKEIEYGIV